MQTKQLKELLKPENKDVDVADFVLSPFPHEDRQIVERMISDASNALEVVIKEGILKAMQEYNSRAYKEEN